MNAESILREFANGLPELPLDKRRISLPLIPLSAEALLVRALAERRGGTIVWITDGTQTLEQAHRDLLTLSPSADDILYFPAWETAPGPGEKPDPDISGLRLDVVSKLMQRAKTKAPLSIVVTCIQAIMQKTVGGKAFIANSASLSVGEDHQIEALVSALETGGYAFVPEVAEKGQAGLKGGLLDVWPPVSEWPLRIEFLGTTIESIRTFNPVDQRSVARLQEALISPADEWKPMASNSDNPESFLSFLGEDTILVHSNIESIAEHAAVYDELIAESELKRVATPYDELKAAMDDMEYAVQISTGMIADEPDMVELDVKQLEGSLEVPRATLLPDRLEEARKNMLIDLQKRASAGQTVAIFFDTSGALDHFKERLPASWPDSIGLIIGALSGGFISEKIGIVVVAEPDLYGRRKTLSRRYDPLAGRPRPEKAAGMRVADLTDIEPGDLVVHIEHGIGRYLGLHEILFNGKAQEVLTIEYAESAKLHVPVSQAHLLSRYVGIAKHSVTLHRLGGKRWNSEKDAAEKAIKDLASSLLEVQAQRNVLKGMAFPPDTLWQHDLEAAFPYQETPDQQKVILEVKNDMESSKPMDRLVCGDAGYGKTEVAMRAAFKAVMAGKQVAVLVPTTVLAQQHYETFTDRMSAYPVRIEMLSRFISRGRHVSVLRSLAEGKVDIVIGTHALVQPNVQFKDLGLVIVDEEQRFGVAHKEQLKELRRLVDVMTLTATPIPRTLYMSLTGARDMSLLQTPPRERMAIETIATPNTDKVIREAVLRELGREGQVFYLHNRIMTIGMVKKRLEEIVPEAKVDIAHGRMASGELSSVMKRFIGGEFDVLLCTTIIESGVDIPRANTILIDRADRFGIADLYQLRGRVGRSSHKAYAYLLLPPHGKIDSDARRRIGALKRHSDLSAGFNLALRDLEIRGAGNILGAAQSGYITAIGFGLYCQLMRATVARLKGEPVPPIIDVDVQLDFITLSPDPSSPDSAAIIPYSYIEDERLRIAVYRKVAEAAVPGEVASLMAELNDRYGPVPAPVKRLLTIARLRIAASSHGIQQVEVKEDKLLLRRGEDYYMKGGKFPRLSAQNPEKRMAEIIRIIDSLRGWPAA